MKGIAVGRLANGIRVMVMDRREFSPTDVRIDRKTGDVIIDGTLFDPREIAEIASYAARRTASRAKAKRKKR